MSTHDPRRRVILRGAIATGCALGIPILLGCKGEQAEQARETSGSAANPAEPPEQQSNSGAGAQQSNGSAGGKLSQADAKYQDSPNGDEQCGNCLHFNAESNTCQVVEGQVSADGWCTMWAKQA